MQQKLKAIKRVTGKLSNSLTTVLDQYNILMKVTEKVILLQNIYEYSISFTPLHKQRTLTEQTKKINFKILNENY